MASTEFKPDFRIGLLSLAGLGGLFLGCFFLFYPDLFTPATRNTIFHEVVYVPKTIIQDRLNGVIDTLQKKDSIIKLERVHFTTRMEAFKKDTLRKDSIARHIAYLDRLSAVNVSDIKILNGYRTSYEYTNAADTVSFKKLNDALHFQFGPEDLSRWDKWPLNKKRDTAFETGYTFKDPGLSFSITGSAKLATRDAISDIGFIAKYPAVGIWILLLLVFCSFLIIAILTCFYLKKKIHDLFKDHSVTGMKNSQFVWTIVIVFISLVAIWLIGKLSFNDEEVVRGIFFMYHLEYSMLLVQVIGFTGGACCLAGFIYTASMLAFFATQVKSAQKAINVTKAGIREKEEGEKLADPMKVTADELTKENQPLLNSQQNEIRLYKELFEKLRGYFQTYFILSAIILSLLVLCTGGLYSILNNLDFMKLLSNDWGFSPTRNDFIYLYGGLYTIILLLVYIPAKMRFSEISFPIDADDGTPAKGQDAADNKKWYGFLKNPFAQLTDLLVAASPLLASLVQSLFDVLFG